jgi:hypothetical protein
LDLPQDKVKLDMFVMSLREVTAPGTAHGAFLNSLYSVQDA